MVCDYAVPVNIPHTKSGIETVISNKNGHSIKLSWTKAYPSSVPPYVLAYNIYFSTLKDDIYAEGVKYVSIDPDILGVEIGDFTPGDTLYFAVRATQFQETWVNLESLPDQDDVKYYPEAILQQAISDTDTTLIISDIELFPNYGIVQIETELIAYRNKDIASGALVNCVRGFLGSKAVSHAQGLLKFWKGLEEQNTVCMQETPVFTYPEYPHTAADGYKEVLKDWLTTDLSASDASQADFPRYDFSGWRRTDIGAILRGECVDTYIGGEFYCADGYDGVGRMLRGLPINVRSHQNEEVLLDTIGTGDLCVLLTQTRIGKRCKCFTLYREHPEERCPSCRGSGFVVGWQQFFNHRISSGLIRVRFSPVDDSLKLEETGLEPQFQTDAWTLVYPAIKDRDVLVRLNEDGTEEFRYEVLSVNRNKLLDGLSGAQKLRVQRIRRTDAIYTVRVNYDTSTIPFSVQTGLGFVPGPGGIQPHVHTIKLGPKIVNVTQINQNTEVTLGHSHAIVNGVILTNPADSFSHTHEIIFP